MLKKIVKNSKEALEHFVMRVWERPGFWAYLLFPISLLFVVMVSIRRLGFKWGWLKTHYLPVPVVVVGNVRVGGTGKTPIVIALVAALRTAGWTPGVISRGYGVRFTGVRAVRVEDRADEVGDEPVLIAQRTQAPIWVGVDRVAAGRALCLAHPEVDIIISDDGLQHYRLGRDIELVVFDERLAGNGFVLPAGPLRESVRRRRDATLFNQKPGSGKQTREIILQWAYRHVPQIPAFMVQLETGFAWCLANSSEQRALDEFVGQRVIAAAGIGAPERFFDTLRRQGIQPVTYAFPDHFVYSARTFSALDDQLILITEKDAVKCRLVLPDHIAAKTWVVPIDAVLEPKCIQFLLDRVKAVVFKK